MSQIRKGFNSNLRINQGSLCHPLPPIKLSLQHGIRKPSRLCVPWLSGTFCIQLSSFRSQTILRQESKLISLEVSVYKHDWVHSRVCTYLFILATGRVWYQVQHALSLCIVNDVLKLGTLVCVKKHLLNLSSNYANTHGSIYKHVLLFPRKPSDSPWKPHQRECGQNAPLITPLRGG